MLYRFTSQATTDLTMHQIDGETILGLLGKPISAQGIITVEQLPAAIETLEAASLADRATGAPQPADVGEDCEGEGEVSVSLAQRLVPLLQLLRLAREAGKAVVWGV